MRVQYQYSDADFLKAFQVQSGNGGIPVFSGSRRQRGGGILGTAFKFLSRYAIPVIKNMFIPTAARVVSSAYDDVKDNKNTWGSALKTSLKKELVGSGLTDIKRRGRKRKATQIPLIPTKRSRTAPKKRKRRRITRQQVLM